MVMDSIASNSYRSACRMPWQKSMDSQEFGFACTLINSMEVAPADELFFKGQLLPLQMDPRLHLVQALSNCEEASSRGASSRSPYGSRDEEVIELNSCFVGCTAEAGCAPACSENRSTAISSHASNTSTADHCPLILEHAPSFEQGLQREPSMLSWCKGKELLPCRVEGDILGLDNNMAGIRDQDNPSLSQALPCDQADPRATPQSGPRLSLPCIDEETKGPWLSYWSRDEDIRFSSCRIEGDVGVALIGNSMMDMRSLSFRSQNSGFWDSGADKDTGDSSSSSRDSNGSSQDSYLPSNTTLETPSCSALRHGPHAKASFHILWKSLLKKASNKAATTSSSSSSPLSISRMGYSEDLRKHKDALAHSSKDLKEVIMLPPWKLESVASAEKSRSNQDKKGKSKGILSSGLKSKSALCNAAEEDVIAHMSTVASKGLISSKGIKGERDDQYEKEEMKRKQQKAAAIKKRWQEYARRLRPLYEMKRGLMGQFGIDECGRRAFEAVESGNIYAARSSTPAVQRRLSHQISLFENQKLEIQEQTHVCEHTHMQKGSTMLAVSSCPPSTRSSPKHSGVLAAIDKAPRHKSTLTTSISTFGTKKTNISKDTSTNKFGISATHANKNARITSHSTLPSSNYSSISTMQELHTALQSAIAHCKESIKEA